jgi:cell division protein FtsB
MYINNYTEETVIMPMADGEYVLFETYKKIKEENKQLKARISELEGGKQDLGREDIRSETKEEFVVEV